MLEQLKRRVERGESWPLVLVVIVATLVPAVCVLWFMNKAVYNESLADRQRRQDQSRLILEQARNRCRTFFTDQRAALDKITWEKEPDVSSAPQLFASVVTKDLADSVIVYNEAGERLYPNRPQPQPEASDPIWLSARNLEFSGNPVDAATLYQRLAQQNTNKHHIARALLGEGRCLAKAGKNQEAIHILSGPLLEPRLRGAADAQGRLIAPNALLMALNLATADHDDFQTLAIRLKQLLVDYQLPMPSSQRRFLMNQAFTLSEGRFQFPMMEAETLIPKLPNNLDEIAFAERFVLVSDGIWVLSSPNKHLLAIYHEAFLIQHLTDAVQGLAQIGQSLEVLPPGSQNVPDDETLIITLNEDFPGWRIVLQDPQQGLEAIPSLRTKTYYGIGGFVILAIFAAAVVMARHLASEIRLTYFKNDMVASVTHELKTPLASMRMLTDTLLDGHYMNPELTHDYLQMISRENHRLSRLIENFLTFSRMERNQQSYDRQPFRVSELLEQALATVEEKMQAAGFEIETHLLHPGPSIFVDRDAFITVLLNLLENAYKYSENNRQVNLHVQTNERNEVIIIVADQGIGLSKRNAKKIFDRFYRVDRGLSRKSEGVGLGLNIVKNIIDGHEGSISVESKLGEGSQFKIVLPIYRGSHS